MAQDSKLLVCPQLAQTQPLATHLMLGTCLQSATMHQPMPTNNSGHHFCLSWSLDTGPGSALEDPNSPCSRPRTYSWWWWPEPTMLSWTCPSSQALAVPGRRPTPPCAGRSQVTVGENRPARLLVPGMQGPRRGVSSHHAQTVLRFELLYLTARPVRSSFKASCLKTSVW